MIEKYHELTPLGLVGAGIGQEGLYAFSAKAVCEPPAGGIIICREDGPIDSIVLLGCRLGQINNLMQNHPNLHHPVGLFVGVPAVSDLAPGGMRPLCQIGRDVLCGAVVKPALVAPRGKGPIRELFINCPAQGARNLDTFHVVSSSSASSNISYNISHITSHVKGYLGN